MRRGRIVSGGSTLTMQVARLLEPREQRSLTAKLRSIGGVGVRGSAGDPSHRGAGTSEGRPGTGDAAALLPSARSVGLIDLYA